MPTTTLSTTLLESVNIVLANLGESPVNSLSGGALPQQVSLALNTIEEVSTDIQSKGWWFNQKTGSNYDTTANVVIYPSNTTNDWGSNIPEEARRYITIRASRIAQTRLIGSEELQKFSYNEELVSLAVLQQAHVRNSNGVLDFNSFPAELRGLGMDEVMFLQGNVEEKIGTLRLGGELANIAKTKAETALLADQEELVTKQALTEVKKALDVVADTDLKALQGGLLTKQTLTEVQNALKVIAEAALIADQENLVEQQVLTEVQETTKRTREAELIDAQEALLQKQILTEAEQVAKVQEEVDLLQTQDTLVAAQATDVAADTALKTNQSSLVASQKTQLDATTAIEASAEKAFYDGVVAGTQDTYRDFAAEMRIMGVQEAAFQQTPAYKKIEILKDAAKLRLATATERGYTVDTLVTDTSVNASPLSGTWTEFRKNLGKPQYKLKVDGVTVGDIFWGLRANTTTPRWNVQYFSNGVFAESFEDTASADLVENWTILNPAEGYVSSTTHTIVNFNATRVDIELLEVNKVMRFIGEPPVTALNSDSLASECVRLLRDTDTELQGRGWWFNIDEDGVIVPKALGDTPQKYREYLSVRVAILLTELYPQSGVDIQRLPKMEAELRAYFKDREFTDANYSIFDSYDVASRIGINRNYDLI
jgi:hypothetical protein